jgi:hypothetical protein
MSRDRTNVVSVVIITVCVTAFLLVGGLVVVSRYLSPPAVATAQEEAPAEAPAPRPRTPRARQSADGNLGQDAGTSSGQSPADLEAEQSATGALADSTSGGEDLEPAASAAGTEAASEAPSAQEAAAPPATSAQADARTIMQESQRRSEAKFYRYDGQLQSFDTKNKVTEKRWTFDRVGSNGQSKSVLRFTAPAEVKGVALLIYNHPDRASDQWMWTPALERDRRIALQDRSTRFFGTDFSFEDLEERDVEQYDYAMLGDEVIDGAGCWKIQTTPKKSRASHYTRSIAWIRKDNYVMARLDNYVDDEVVKRLSNSSIENIQGIWTARQLEMADLKRGTRTRLTLQQVKYNDPMKDSDFTLDAIRR